MKKLTTCLAIVAILACSIIVSISPSAAISSGDMIWTWDYPADIVNDVAVDSTGIYIAGVWSGWGIIKHDLTRRWSVHWTKRWSDGRACAVAVDNTGVYIVGSDSSRGSTDTRWHIEKRSLTTGNLIWVRTVNPSRGWDEATGVAVDSSAVYIVGWDSGIFIPETGARLQRWRIEKRNPTSGNLIKARTFRPIRYGYGRANDVAVDDTGVYVVGYGIPSGSTDRRWCIEKRSLTDLGRIWRKTFNPSSGWDEPRGVAVDSTGVYVVGYDTRPGNARWRMQKRRLTDGGRIWSRVSNPSSGWDEATGVAVDSTGVYVVGYDTRPGNARWRMQKRRLTDGGRIWSRVSNPTTGSDWASGVAVDSTGVYIVGTQSGARSWRVEKRYP